MSGATQPTGTVTLLFSDIEASTLLLRRLGEARYAEALDLHRRLLREAFGRHGGYEVDHEGDAFFVAFPRADGAVAAAADAQRALAHADWPDGAPIRVRIGIHTGQPLAVPPKYVGVDVHQAARIMAAGHGGQVVVSDITRQLCGVAESFAFRDLGEHRLKDLSGPQRLHQLVLEDLPDDFPPLATLAGPANLPVQPNRLIGRERELADIRDALVTGQARLLTLTGPGGVGKTRLALQVAVELVDHYPDGVVFVTLAPVRDHDLVLPTVAQALGLRERPGESIASTTRSYLSDRKTALVLDNFEHVVSAAPFLAELLSAAPALALLVTSREPLRVSGEQLFPVEPLSLPETNTVAHALESDSVALFVERAAAVRPGFQLDAENVHAVAAICARLDGLPLAIELAAARVGSLSPRAIERRLDRSLAFLTGGARDADDRQRTLAGTIDWSYGLLDEDERRLFVRSSVFVGGFRPDAAQMVCDPEAALDVVDRLGALVDKCLLRQRDDPDGEPRYSMFESIREYAASKLQASTQELQHRHARWALSVAAESYVQLTAEDQLGWLDRMEREHDNMRAALSWAEAARNEDIFIGLVWALSRFWGYRGHSREGLEWATRAIDAATSEGLRARASLVRGYLGYYGSNLEASVADFERAVAGFEGSGENELLGKALIELGWARLARGDEEEARVAAEAGLTLVARKDAWDAAHARQLLGAVSRGEDAIAHFAAASAGFRRLGDAQAAAWADANLGYTQVVAGEYAGARDLLVRSLEVLERVGNPVETAAAHGNLGLAKLFDRDPDGAADHFERQLETGLEFQTGRLIAEALAGLAGVLAMGDDVTAAARLLGAGAAVHTEIGVSATPVMEEAVEQQLVLPRVADPARYARDRAAGAALTAAEAAAEAIDRIARIRAAHG